LIVSYYFPPMGLSGVLRPAKFVKYLVRLGWDIEVLTSSPRSYYAFDDSLMGEIPDAVHVIRAASLDLHHLVRHSGRVTSALPGAAGRNLSRFVLFPDSKIGWYPFAVAKSRRQVEARKPDAVLATGPPWTSFLVGRAVAKRMSAPLVLDYRDSWLMDPQSPVPTGLHRWAAARLESHVVGTCSAVIAVNETVRAEILSRYPHMAGKVHTIFNGFDPEDHDHLPGVESVFKSPPGKRLRLLYMGTLYQDVNRPHALLEALKLLRGEYPGGKYLGGVPVEAVFMGMTDPKYTALAGEMGIGDLVRFVPYMPHREALASLAAADAAVLFVDPHPHADRHVPGKLFEYLGARLPILAVAPAAAEAAQIVEENAAGAVVPPDDPGAIAGTLAAWIDMRLAGRPLPAIAGSALSPFDRRKQAETLHGVLKDLL